MANPFLHLEKKRDKVVCALESIKKVVFGDNPSQLSYANRVDEINLRAIIRSLKFQGINGSVARFNELAPLAITNTSTSLYRIRDTYSQYTFFNKHYCELLDEVIKIVEYEKIRVSVNSTVLVSA